MHIYLRNAASTLSADQLRSPCSQADWGSSLTADAFVNVTISLRTHTHRDCSQTLLMLCSAPATWFPGGVTVADLNDNLFAVALQANTTNNPGATWTARVDFLQLTVTYTRTSDRELPRWVNR